MGRGMMRNETENKIYLTGFNPFQKLNALRLSKFQFKLNLKIIKIKVKIKVEINISTSIKFDQIQAGV